MRLVDLLGTGMAGVLWSRDADGRSRPRMLLPRLHRRRQAVPADADGQPPRRASPASSTPPRRSSTWHDERDRATRWRRRCRSRCRSSRASRSIDEISGGKLTTEYRYHHGYWDGAEREFRGFGRVDQLDTETFDATTPAAARGAVRAVRRGVLAADRDATWFHLGPVGDEVGDWTELDRADEYWPGDPPLLSPAAR